MSVRGPLGATPQGAFDFTGANPRPREALSASGGWSGLAGLAGLLVSGLVISMSASKTDLLLPQSVRPLPDVLGLTGAFGHFGINLRLGGLTAVLTLMLVSYALVLRAARQLSARVVLMSIAALNALVLLAPPLFSTDLFSYIAYGRVGTLYGLNPYLYGPSAIFLDHVYPFIGVQWIKTPTVYGPLFTAISYPLSHLSIATNVFAYKAIAALSSLAIVVVVWQAARLRGLDPVKAVVLVGLNPVVLVYGVGGGHNDLLMLAIMVLAIYVLLRRRERAGGAMIVVAAAVKLTAGILLPFAIAMSASRGDGSAGRRRVLTGAAVAAAIFTGLGLWLFGIGPLHIPLTLQQIQSAGGIHSVSGFILGGFGLGQFGSAVGIALDVGFLALLVWLVRRVWRGEMDWITGAGWATVAMLLTAGLLLPWYVAWLLPLAALSTDRRLWVIAVLLTGLGLTSL